MPTEAVYICFEKPWCDDEACCCGAGLHCIDGVEWGTIEEYGAWLGTERYSEGLGAIAALFNPLTFNYLSSTAAQNSSFWSGGVSNTTRWSTAWLMPGYAKFFESETSENYKMRVMIFKGWAVARDVYSSGWKKDTVKRNRTDTHLGYHFSNIGENWNNITFEGSSTNTTRGSEDSKLDTMSGGEGGVDEGVTIGGLRTDIFNTAKKADNELDAVMGYGKYMLISRTTFYDDEQSEAETAIGKHSNMPWPLCRLPPSVAQAQRMEMNDNQLSSRRGLGAGNPSPALNASGDVISVGLDDSARAYAVVYNPRELKGLIERFGPYEYLEDGAEFMPGPADAAADADGWISTGFVVDRRTISRIKHWYGHHTLQVGFGITIAGDPSAAIFRKTKSPAYKKSDLYTLGREVEATPSGAPTTYRGRAGGVRGPEDSVAIGDGVMTMVIPPAEDY